MLDYKLSPVMHYRTISLARNPFYRSFVIAFLLGKNLISQKYISFFGPFDEVRARPAGKTILKVKLACSIFDQPKRRVKQGPLHGTMLAKVFSLSLPPHLRQTEHNDV